MDTSLTKKHDSVYTIGHSTRTSEAFICLLKLHDIELVVDVRTIPRSRRIPHFNMENLPSILRSAGITYLHMPGLGGFRHPRHDSLNKAWRNTSFRGFADYMQTKEFDDELKALIKLAQYNRIVLMCAEAVPWRCHRSLIADALSVQGIHVEHIISRSFTQSHTLPPWAKVVEKHIVYPLETDLLSTSVSVMQTASNS